MKIKKTQLSLPDADDDDDDENEEWLLKLEWRIFIGDFLSSKPIN